MFTLMAVMGGADWGRLITKGYRMEKRLVAFDCRPLRFFCGKCERAFTIDETERVDRHKSESFHHIVHTKMLY